MHYLKTNRWIPVAMLALALLTAMTVGLGRAQGTSPDEGSQPEAATGPAGVEGVVIGDIPIQGRLTDAAGKAVPDGIYAITFRIYDADVAGTLLCEDTDHLPVTDGLFSALIGYCTADDINGQALWLGIQVEGDDEMVPRQQIAPVPYAWSLRPGAQVSGTVDGDAVVHAENWASNGRGLRGWARTASGVNYGVIGGSWSPDGYGGYFDNDGGGYALGVEGAMEMTVNATGAQPINVGDRYRDNAIIAWANVNSDGTIGWEFGVTSVARAGPGNYIVEIDAETAGTSSFIPMAIAEVESQPDSAAAARIVSVNQTAQSIFRVYITDGTWAMVDNQFLFMVTGR